MDFKQVGLLTKEVEARNVAKKRLQNFINFMRSFYEPAVRCIFVVFRLLVIFGVHHNKVLAELNNLCAFRRRFKALFEA